VFTNVTYKDHVASPMSTNIFAKAAITPGYFLGPNCAIEPIHIFQEDLKDTTLGKPSIYYINWWPFTGGSNKKKTPMDHFKDAIALVAGANTGIVFCKSLLELGKHVCERVFGEQYPDEKILAVDTSIFGNAKDCEKFMLKFCGLVKRYNEDDKNKKFKEVGISSLFPMDNTSPKLYTVAITFQEFKKIKVDDEFQADYKVNLTDANVDNFSEMLKTAHWEAFGKAEGVVSNGGLVQSLLASEISGQRGSEISGHKITLDKTHKLTKKRFK